ncbi:MAG TPA: hypothetical protein VKN76_12095 [Kiloniellaceae bacterium]|nr:hypothetical protein [Kiloniellaceae bacterium]
MPYFDSGEAYDLALLADSVQSDTRIAAEAARAEREIVNRYTEELRRRPIGTDYAEVYELADGVRGVFLRGYDEDETAADGYDATRSAWTGFAAAMRQAIADLVSHRIIHFNADPSVVSERRGARSITRKGPVNKKWPVGWDSGLSFYDIRRPLYAIG